MNSLINEMLALEKKGTIDAILEFDQKLDDYFHLNISMVEAELESREEEAYIGLDFRALLTSYIDYYNILKRIPSHETLVDLGAGYCRGTLLSKYMNLARCVSYEFVANRTFNAQKYLANFTSDNLIRVENLATALLPKAYAYYLYFPRGEILDIILGKLFKISEHNEILLYACESHGDLLEYLRSLKRLEIVDEFKCLLPRHYENIVCFKFKKMDTVTLHWKTNLALWLLLTTNKKEYAFIINYFHLGFREHVKWLVPLNDVEWVMYQGRECLLYKKGRIIEINKNETILGIEKMDRLALTFCKQDRYKKVFLRDGKYDFETI